MHNRSEMVAVLGPLEALPYYIHTYIQASCSIQSSACCLLHAGLFYGLLHNREDGGDKFLRIVTSLSCLWLNIGLEFKQVTWNFKQPSFFYRV
jgi:hypothetical protein